jgi:hypothetical protein
MINDKQLETIDWELKYNLEQLHKAVLNEAKNKAKGKIPRLVKLRLDALRAINSLIGEANALNGNVCEDYPYVR